MMSKNCNHGEVLKLKRLINVFFAAFIGVTLSIPAPSQPATGTHHRVSGAAAKAPAKNVKKSPRRVAKKAAKQAGKPVRRTARRA
jgi:hypothetical protein